MKKNVLITGAAKRIGATCVRMLHQQGYNIFLHYKSSEQHALALATQLNQIRNDSVKIMQANLLNRDELLKLTQQAESAWGSLDILINNASVFYPQSVADVSDQDWEVLLGSNLKAPFFLCQQLAPCLLASRGCIINIIDIHAQQGLKGYPVYSIAKAGLASMTQILAQELAPIRVNGVAPGAILWPESDLSQQNKADILQKIALNRKGDPEDIAKTVLFLAKDAPYITGQIITVDGGRK